MAPHSQALCYVLRTSPDGPEVLLGHKLRGFGEGKVVGMGGHVDAGLTAEEYAIREMRAGTGIVMDPGRLSERATITLLFPAKPEWDAVVRVFLGEEWSGETVGSPEMSPRWYRIDELPFADMWDDERHWLPRVLRGERLAVTATYDEMCEKVVDAVVQAAG